MAGHLEAGRALLSVAARHAPGGNFHAPYLRHRIWECMSIMAGVSPVRAGAEPMFYRIKVVKGRCYLAKEWWDPVLGKKITRSIGPCDLIEQVMNEWKASRNSKRGSRGFAPRWRRGRDLNPGHGLDRPAY